MNWTGPPRNGEPQTGQSLGQKIIPNASCISHTLRAKSTLRRYARLGYRHFVDLLPLFHCLRRGQVALDLLGYDSNADGFVGSAPTGRFYDRWQQA